MKFQNQVVWITGASSGLGEALAYAFRREGARLILSSRSVSELERVRAACGADPKQVAVLPLDLEDIESLKGKAEQALAAFGRVDVLVNNGGVGTRGRAAETPVALDERIMRVNYLGHVALTKAILPSMIARKHGHIVVISSVMGKLGVSGGAAYAASKHALHGFFDSLRAETWREGIRVTLAVLGYVRTNISFNALTPAGTPLGRMDRAHTGAMSPEAAAGQIILAVARGKEEVYIGRETLALHLHRLWPGAVRWGVRRFRR